jgi:hypothetical protein
VLQGPTERRLPRGDGHRTRSPGHPPVRLREAVRAAVPGCDDVATFLGRSPERIGERETGGDFSIRRHGLRIEGTRIRHCLGPASIKMYDKHGFILRVETTRNDVTFFRHHRMVEQRDGQRGFKLAALRKSIYSLSPDLASISRAANDRYIQFLSSIDDPTPGLKALSKISESVDECDHRYRGFNLFDDDDQTLFEVLCRGQFFIHGFRNRSLLQHLKQFRSSQISRLLERLRLHGIIKKIGRTYKYYLTEVGRHAAIAGLTLKNLFLVAGSRPLPWPTDRQILAFLQSIVRRTDYPWPQEFPSRAPICADGHAAAITSGRR